MYAQACHPQAEYGIIHYISKKDVSNAKRLFYNTPEPVRLKNTLHSGENMNELSLLIDDYRAQGAPQDQQMLIALLRDVQTVCGGTLSGTALTAIAQELDVKETMLLALIRRIPSLRLDTVPNLLEMCQTCPKGRELRAWVENTFHVQSGGSCEAFGFAYRTVPCMKNCKNGPSVKWNGTLCSHATRELLEQLIRKGGK